MVDPELVTIADPPAAFATTAGVKELKGEKVLPGDGLKLGRGRRCEWGRLEKGREMH